MQKGFCSNILCLHLVLLQTNLCKIFLMLPVPFQGGLLLQDAGCTDQLKWLPSKEIFSSEAVTIKDKEACNKDLINIGSEKLFCVKPSSIFCAIKTEELNIDENILFAEQNHSDLIPSKYEGGLKLWECTHDIANYLNPTEVSGKSVLDLGCGTGLLGILALKLGAHNVLFQDYNADVLRYATIPNAHLNATPQQLCGCRFFCGDWASFAEVSLVTYDLVITSETIYNPQNYGKLHDTILRVLRPTGTVLVGAKSYYFGLGGSTRQFEKLIKERNIFNVEVVWKCSEGVQREILKLTFKDRDIPL